MFSLSSSSSRKKDNKKDTSGEKPDRLKHDALASADGVLLSATGVPGTADALAYEPIQGLIAVSTSDGKIKLFGRPGCEATLYSSARYPYATRQLQFLQNRGVLVRVSKGGFMECWSVVSGDASDGGLRSLGTVKVRGDKICCVADMARDPYLLLGCASGSLRIAMLVDGIGSPTTHPRQARGLVVAPYRVRPSEMQGEGEVRQLAVQSFGPVHRALVLFTSGIVSVWDLRGVELVTSINPCNPGSASYTSALEAAGDATAVCWIGTDGGDFATGHVSGSVLVWALPGLDPGDAWVARVLRVVDGAAEPIRMIRCISGEVDGLLVLGGQEVEQPEGLTWLSLSKSTEGGEGGEEEGEKGEEEESEEDEEHQDHGSAQGSETFRRRPPRRRVQRKRHVPSMVKLPWFGHLIGFCLVVDGGCVTGYEAPSGVLQLVEGGQLVLHHLKDEQPHMVAPQFQQRHNITVTEAPLVPVRRPSGSSPSTISLTGLRMVAAEVADRDEIVTHAFSCGPAPAPPADATWGLVYCTGYKDGGVCLWDLNGGTTRLLCAAPAGDAVDEIKSSGSSSGAVTCLSLVWPTGLLLAGHHKGEVRMYQFSAAGRRADCVTLESVNTPGFARLLNQPSGLQLRLRVLISSGEITSLAYCQSIRAVAAGDKAGGIALIDTAKPVVRWYAMPAQQAVLACALAPLPLPPARARVPEVVGEDGAPSHAVVIADTEGRIAALDAARGCFIGRSGELCPKNASYTLMMEVLDEEFNPLWARRQIGAGCDQAALAGSPAGARRSDSGRGTHSRGHGGEEEYAKEEEADGGEEEEAQEEHRSRGGATRKGRSRGGRRAEDERGGGGGGAEEDSEEDDNVEGMDVDTLLAKAAGQVERPRARGEHRSRTRSGGGDAGGSPPVLSTCPDPTGHYVLLVTDQYLRLYTTSNVVTAERSTVAKRSPAAHQQLVYARPIQAAGAPGVMALAAAEHGLCVQVYSLPSLELVHEMPLSASLSWFWDVPPGHERRLGRLAATSRLGHLLLLGLSNELLMLGLAAGLPPPVPPRKLFDSAVAAAALSAASKYEDEHNVKLARLRRPTEGAPPPAAEQANDSFASSVTPIEGVDSPMVRTEGRRVEKPTAAASLTVPLVVAEKAAGKVAEAANTTFTRVFTKVQQGLTRAVEETTRGVKQLATVGAALIDGAAGGGVGATAAAPSNSGDSAPRHDAQWYASLPDLGAVFSRTVPEDDVTLARIRRRRERWQHGGRSGGGDGGTEEDDDVDDDVSILSITEDEEEEEDEEEKARPRPRGVAAAPARSAATSANAAAAQAPPPSSWVRRQPQPQPPPQASAPRRAGGVQEESSLRSELFGGPRSAGGATSRSTGGVSQPRTRTADEIKRAYGRTPAAGRANEVRSVMEQNRSKLEERGEKLRQLNDKAADLENSAAGFAEMAKQLAERERNKKWWQL